MAFATHKKEDNIWIIGRHTTVSPAPYPVGINVFDFKEDPVKISDVDTIKLFFFSTCAVYYDGNGDFNYVKNGMHILGPNFKEVKNGDTINYNGKYFNLWVSNYADGSKRFLGFNKSQAMIMLPWPEKDSVFMLLTTTYILMARI